jgi:hypothetical protein
MELPMKPRIVLVLALSGCALLLAPGCIISDHCGDGVCDPGLSENCTSCPADCGGCGSQGTLRYFWNINGTVDGTATGTSIDACSDVSATMIRITIDGVTYDKDCNATGSGGAMSADFSVTAGSHAITATLYNGSSAITTTFSANDSVGTGETKDYELSFGWDSFAEPTKSSTKGDFGFKVTWESGKTCSQTSPQVGSQITLLTLDGTTVTTKVCGTDGSCVNTDGATAGKCYDTTQSISQIRWGDYKLRVEGIVGSLDVCWQKKDIAMVVGAGTNNPTFTYDVPRISTSGSCQ